MRDARAGIGDDAFNRLARLSLPALASGLRTDPEKLAFWINVYNGGIQYELRRDPGAYRFRSWFFARRGVTVAGRWLSFNAIEHGMLRRSMFGYSLGYVSNPLPGSFERRFRMRVRDPRVHFALNCGATSCPPISGYDPDQIESQLDLAARSYLEGECRFDRRANRIELPRLFLWFRGDFGGPAGIHDILRRHQIVPPGTRPRLRYRDYDWSLRLD